MVESADFRENVETARGLILNLGDRVKSLAFWVSLMDPQWGSFPSLEKKLLEMRGDVFGYMQENL